MIATVIVASIVAAVFIAIIAVSVVNKKKGKGSCSCGCTGCANREFCHPVKAKKEKTDK